MFNFRIDTIKRINLASATYGISNPDVFRGARTTVPLLRTVTYGRGGSMNGTPTVSWQRLCAIDRVKLKVT